MTRQLRVTPPLNASSVHEFGSNNQLTQPALNLRWLCEEIHKGTFASRTTARNLPVEGTALSTQMNWSAESIAGLPIEYMSVQDIPDNPSITNWAATPSATPHPTWQTQRSWPSSKGTFVLLNTRPKQPRAFLNLLRPLPCVHLAGWTKAGRGQTARSFVLPIAPGALRGAL